MNIDKITRETSPIKDVTLTFSAEELRAVCLAMTFAVNSTSGLMRHGHACYGFVVNRELMTGVSNTIERILENETKE